MKKYFWKYNMQNFFTFLSFHVLFLTPTIVAQSRNRKANVTCLSHSLYTADTDIEKHLITIFLQDQKWKYLTPTSSWVTNLKVTKLSLMRVVNHREALVIHIAEVKNTQKMLVLLNKWCFNSTNTHQGINWENTSNCSFADWYKHLFWSCFIPWSFLQQFSNKY